MNHHIQKRENLPQNWDFQKLMEEFQLSSNDPMSFLELHWVCSNAHLASKPFESPQPNQFAADWFFSEESWMARYQFQVYDLDEFYMMFVRYWKWKFDGYTSGFCFGKLWLTLCIFGINFEKWIVHMIDTKLTESIACIKIDCGSIIFALIS